MQQWGPEGPIRPIGFYSRSFKDAEKRYSTWEKGLFVVSLALQEAEKNYTTTVNHLMGVLKPILAGTPHPVGLAQSETIKKWYARLEHYSHMYRVEEGAPKTLQIQEGSSISPDKEPPPSYIKEAP